METESPNTSVPNEQELPALDPPAQLKTQAKNNDVKNLWQDYNNFKTNLSNNFTKATTQNAQDQFFYNRPASYNPESTTNINQNFDRYYSHPSFEKLGFNPWQNNEAVYNEKASGWGDVGRALISATKMIPTGFKSAVRSYADVATGDFFAQDVESEKEMQRANIVGMSTRGGVSGFTSNLLTSAGYTIGIGLEMAAEGTLATFLTPETGGASAAIGGARIVNNGVNAAKTLGNFFKVAKNFNKAVASLKNYEVAKSAYNVLKGGINLLNPLGHTTDLIKTLKSSDNITNLAKVSKTAAAFHKDVMIANASLAESKLEGASTSRETRESLISDFYAKNQRQPNREELSQIETLAQAAGDATLGWNFPVILLTNKITFDPLLKRFAPMEDYITRAGARFIEKKGEGFVKESFTTAVKGLLKPKTYGKASLNYFKENFSEGLQESLQEVIAGTSKDYYRSIYNNASKQGLDQSVGENYAPNIGGILQKNVAEQFSGKGFETFASGFFMGGLLKIQGPLVQAGVEGYNRIFDKERYEAYRQKKEEYNTQTLEKLNELYKDPLKYFGSRIINYGNSSNTVSNQNASSQNNDKKTWQDIDDQNVWSHLSTALDTNTYDVFMSRIQAIRTMTPDAIKEAYGVDGQEVLAKLDKIVERGQYLKDRYQEWNNKASNPFNPSLRKKDTPEYIREAQSYMAWEQAKKNAIFYGYSFDRNVDRIKSIKNELNGAFPGIDFTSVSTLFNLPSMNKELSLLKSEISSLKGLSGVEAKKDLGKKERAFEHLQNFRTALENYFITQSASNLSEEERSAYFEDFKEFSEVSEKKLKDTFKAYIKNIAKENNTFYSDNSKLDESFAAIKDIHTLEAENRNLTETINMLSSPKGFIEHYNRINSIFNEMWKNKDADLKKGIEETYSRIEINNFLNSLYRLGYVVNDEELSQLLAEGTVPERFYNVATKETVNKGESPDYLKFEALVKDFLGLRKGESVEEPVEEVPEQSAEILQEFAPVPQNSDIEEVEEAVVTEKVSKPTYNLKERIERIKTLDDLLEYQNEIMTILGNYDKTVESGIDKEVEKQIFDTLASLENRFISEFDPNNIEVGDVFQMENRDYDKMIVDKIFPNSVKFKKLGDSALSVTIKKENLMKEIKFKYEKSIREEDGSVVNKEERKKSAENIENVDLLSQDVNVLKTLQDQAQQEGAEKVTDDFINNLGCK